MHSRKFWLSVVFCTGLLLYAVILKSASARSQVSARDACEFIVQQPGQMVQQPNLVQPEAAKVILTAPGGVALSEWIDADRILITRDLDAGRQEIGLLDITAGELIPLASRNYNGSAPQWLPARNVPVYLDMEPPSDNPAGYSLYAGDQLLLDGLGFSNLDMGVDGKLYYFTRTDGWISNVWEPHRMGTNIPQGGLSETVPLPDRTAAEIRRWSAPRMAARPRSNDLVYYHQQGLFLVQDGVGCVLNLAEERELRWALDARWSLDGRFLALITTTSQPNQAKGRGSEYRSTELTVLDFVERTVSTWTAGSFSPDLRFLTDLSWRGNEPILAVLGIGDQTLLGADIAQLHLLDVRARTSQVITLITEVGGGLWGTQLAWSLDGSRLAVSCPTGDFGRACLLDFRDGTPAGAAAVDLVRQPRLDERIYLPLLLTPPSTAFSPPSTLTIEMYWLNANGARRKPYTQCGPGDTTWGCTAFCNDGVSACQGDAVFEYPYETGTIQVDVEAEYLLNVVPQELGGWYDPVALAAQAVAARTYAFYYRANPPTLVNFNNSAFFQVFVPRKFEAQYPAKYPSDDDDNRWDAPCTEDYSSLNSSQRRMCDALANPVYLSYEGNDPITAFFASDVFGRTVTWADRPYIYGVDDPISTACDADDFGHRQGMSQEGASRWGRGHQCSYGSAPVHDGNDPGEVWPVRYQDRAQVLVHYYTGVQIRDLQMKKTVPDARWNLLDLRWNTPDKLLPEVITNTQVISASLVIQNTGVISWALPTAPVGAVAIHQHWAAGEVVYERFDPLPGAVFPGDALAAALWLDPALLPPETYTVTLDLAVHQAGGWVPFSELEPDLTWFVQVFSISLK